MTTVTSKKKHMFRGNSKEARETRAAFMFLTPYLVTTIMEGRKNTAMPPWKTMFSHEDAIWITEQLQSGRMQATALAENKSSDLKKSKDQSADQFRNKQ